MYRSSPCECCPYHQHSCDCHRQPVLWVRSKDGKVKPGAIAVGKEKNTPLTFYGRVSIKNERCFGRVIPTSRCCMFIRKGMEHRRVHLRGSSQHLWTESGLEEGLWRPRSGHGHPDGLNDGFQKRTRANCCAKTRWVVLWRGSACVWSSPTCTTSRSTACSVTISPRPLPLKSASHAAPLIRLTSVVCVVDDQTILPGYVVPAQGVVHASYDNNEVVHSKYEVLCLDEALLSEIFSL